MNDHTRTQASATAIKLVQLRREIEMKDSYPNLQHSVSKLCSFIEEDFPALYRELELVRKEMREHGVAGYRM